MKHRDLEGHLHGDSAEGGIGLYSVSFISNTRGTVSSLCGFSVSTEIHHHLKLCFCGTECLACVCMYLCVRQNHRGTHPSFVHF